MWSPRDLSQTCYPHSNINACSSFGYLYLSILSELFGKSVDKQIIDKNYYIDHDGSYSEYSEFIFNLEKNNNTLKLADNTAVDNNLENVDKKEKKREINDKETSNRHRKRRNAKREDRETNEEYDFIVVGAGSAGCVVANRLTEVKNWKVLLLEAGDEQPKLSDIPGLVPAMYGSSVDWAYTTVPDGKACLAFPEGRCSWPRGKMMGGSSSLNSMVYLRGSKRDYDEWEAAGNYGWGFKKVLPYFKKSEDNRDKEAKNRKYHAVGGYQTVERFPYFDKASVLLTEGLEQLGLTKTDLNADRQIGTMITQSTAKDGVRDSTNAAFIRNIRYVRKNLVVKTNAEVIKILIDPHDTTAYGVRYIKNGKICEAHAKKEVIVSAGAINSPKLLMLSGIGPYKHLKQMGIKVIKDLKVGENLQDHVTVGAMPIILPKMSAAPVEKDLIMKEIYSYDKQTSKHYQGPLTSTAANAVVGLMRTKHSIYPADTPDIQIHFDGYDIKEVLTDTTQYLTTRILPMPFYDSVSPRPQLLKPESRGFLLLNSTNIYGPPLIFANYLSTPRDLATMVTAMKLLLNLEHSPSFKKYGAYYWKKPLKPCHRMIWGSDEYLECILRSYTNTAYHPTSTCKMGPKWDEDAVVDPELRVYGVGHLRVVDASIMPSVTRCNTNAPAIMIGEKGADMIKKEWANNGKIWFGD